MAQNPTHGAGCFHASYPDYTWEQVECKVIPPGLHPTRTRHKRPTPAAVGFGNDFVAQASGLISSSTGSFPTVTGVVSEQSVGGQSSSVAGEDAAIDGANEYTLQLNTNANATTAACAGHSGCTVWQQFVYATDYFVKGEAAVFMQYWLIGWGAAACPSGWFSYEGTDCWTNSVSVAAPNVPVTELSQLTLTGTVSSGGNDIVYFFNGTDSFVVGIAAPDSVFDIASVWNATEFNIFGDTGLSEAEFNSGASITVKVAVSDGSTTAPTILLGSATAGETNNLNLGACQAFSGTMPYIQFTESD